MSAEVINLADARPFDQSNGAREALVEVMGTVLATCPPECSDYILASMWERGFKVVPLEPTDEV